MDVEMTLVSTVYFMFPFCILSRGTVYKRGISDRKTIDENSIRTIRNTGLRCLRQGKNGFPCILTVQDI